MNFHKPQIATEAFLIIGAAVFAGADVDVDIWFINMTISKTTGDISPEFALIIIALLFMFVVHESSKVYVDENQE